MSTLRPIILAVAVAVATAGCGQAGPADPTAIADRGRAESVTLTRLRAEPYSLTYNSGLRTPQRTVVRDAAAWQELWAAIWRDHGAAAPLPAVDFSREMVVVVALGERNSGGHSILIDSATVSDGSLQVWVRSISPGPNCVTAGALTEPVDAARLPRVEGRVEFRESSEVSDCR